MEHEQLSMEYLQGLGLPAVPERLEGVLKVNWAGRGGMPGASAVDARTNKKGRPMAIVTFMFKGTILEEEWPDTEIRREFPLYVELLDDLKQQTEKKAA